ncbi:MAG: peptidylprolyl isomerase [Thermodesulfobacteriota bacterium]
MALRKLFLLLIFIAFIGCNQSDSNNSPEKQDTAEEQAQTTTTTNNTATDPEPEREGKIVARVNGSPIYEDDIKNRNLNFVITEEIIYQLGLQQGVDNEINKKVRNFERVLIINKAKESMMENMEPTKKISDEEIQRHYEANKYKYSHVRIHEITVPDVNLGLEVKEKAEAGEELQTIATGYPDIEITVTDIGYNRELAQKFEKKEVGAISEVIQKPNGTFSVLKIVEIKEIPLKASRNSIKHGLESKRIAEMFEIKANRLAEENNITIEIID